MDAIYEASNYPFLEGGEAIVGLDEEFMVRAHLLVPKGGEANNLYSWLLNFQIFDEDVCKTL